MSGHMRVLSTRNQQVQQHRLVMYGYAAEENGEWIVYNVVTKTATPWLTGTEKGIAAGYVVKNLAGVLPCYSGCTQPHPPV